MENLILGDSRRIARSQESLHRIKMQIQFVSF